MTCKKGKLLYCTVIRLCLEPKDCAWHVLCLHPADSGGWTSMTAMTPKEESVCQIACIGHIQSLLHWPIQAPRLPLFRSTHYYKLYARPPSHGASLGSQSQALVQLCLLVHNVAWCMNKPSTTRPSATCIAHPQAYTQMMMNALALLHGHTDIRSSRTWVTHALTAHTTKRKLHPASMETN